MTREQAREKWEIIKAFGEGKTIQFFGASGDWLDLPENFNLPLEEDLRIKEEPSEKKLKWTDLKIKDVIRKKYENGYRSALVTRIDTYTTDKHIGISGEWLSDTELAEDWEKVDYELEEYERRVEE